MSNRGGQAPRFFNNVNGYGGHAFYPFSNEKGQVSNQTVGTFSKRTGSGFTTPGEAFNGTMNDLLAELSILNAVTNVPSPLVIHFEVWSELGTTLDWGCTIWYAMSVGDLAGLEVEDPNNMPWTLPPNS